MVLLRPPQGIGSDLDIRTYIADYSDDPIIMDVLGFSYEVKGLSRIGVDREVILDYSRVGVFVLDPGKFYIPPITLKHISGPTIQWLVEWAEQYLSRFRKGNSYQ
jgi:hypothetical protein